MDDGNAYKHNHIYVNTVLCNTYRDIKLDFVLNLTEASLTSEKLFYEEPLTLSIMKHCYTLASFTTNPFPDHKPSSVCGVVLRRPPRSGVTSREHVESITPNSRPLATQLPPPRNTFCERKRPEVQLTCFSFDNAS